MITKTTTYTDYNGNSRTDTCYFNLTKAEIGKLQMRKNGTFINYIQELAKKHRVEEMYNFVYDLILDSYGERDLEGFRFRKSPEMRTDFEQSIAFSEILMEMLNDPEKLSDFVKKILPMDVVTEGGSVNAMALPETT